MLFSFCVRIVQKVHHIKGAISKIDFAIWLQI